MDDALEIVQVMRSDEMLERNACYYFRVKEETGDFGEIVSILCGWMHSDVPAVPETDVSPDTALSEESDEAVSSELVDEAQAPEEISDKAVEETGLSISDEPVNESTPEALDNNKGQEESDNVL